MSAAVSPEGPTTAASSGLVGCECCGLVCAAEVQLHLSQPHQGRRVGRFEREIAFDVGLGERLQAELAGHGCERRACVRRRPEALTAGGDHQQQTDPGSI